MSVIQAKKLCQEKYSRLPKVGYMLLLDIKNTTASNLIVERREQVSTSTWLVRENANVFQLYTEEIIRVL